jgi:hypothetical protein
MSLEPQSAGINNSNADSGIRLRGVCTNENLLLVNLASCNRCGDVNAKLIQLHR